MLLRLLRTWLLSLVVVILTGCPLAVCAEPPTAEPSGVKTPFFDRRQFPLDYAGPGREDPEPQDIREVRLGYFGPDDPAHPDGGDLWRAAELAIEDVNRQGGYQGKPFRLVARWSDNPWTGGAAKLTQLVYTDNVWALLGGIDSASTHLAEQVTTKARLPLVCAASSDRTIHSAIVPWIFSLLPGNQVQAPLLTAELARRVGDQPFVVIAGEDHDSRSFLAEWNRSLAKVELAPRFQFVYRPGDPASDEQVRRACAADVAAAVLIADAGSSAHLVRELRQAGFQGTILGGPATGRRRCLDEAGPAAEQVICPLLVEPGAGWAAFEPRFRQGSRRQADFAAAATYDAVQLLAAAVRKAGLNRARIGDALRELSPWDGVAGTVRWDTLGGNTRPARLGVISAGQIKLVEQSSSRK